MKYPHVTEVMQPTVDRLRGRHWVIGKQLTDDGKRFETHGIRPTPRHIQDRDRSMDDEREAG